MLIYKNLSDPVDLALSIEQSMSTPECYKLSKSIKNDDEYSIKYLVDVMDAAEMPTPGKSIFFHETTCSKTGLVHLNSR